VKDVFEQAKKDEKPLNGCFYTCGVFRKKNFNRRKDENKSDSNIKLGEKFPWV
jgi:hypothetical protein